MVRELIQEGFPWEHLLHSLKITYLGYERHDIVLIHSILIVGEADSDEVPTDEALDLFAKAVIRSDGDCRCRVVQCAFHIVAYGYLSVYGGHQLDGKSTICTTRRAAAKPTS